MLKVVVPISAVLVFLGATNWNPRLTVVIAVAVVLIGLGAYEWGVWAHRRRPKIAAWAIEGWTAALVMFLAALCVVAAWLGVRIKDASPESADTTTKTLAALGTAALAGLLGWLLDGRSSWSSGGMAQSRLSKILPGLFPAQPQAPPEGIAAWQSVDQAVFHRTAEAWTVRFRTALFETVKRAMDVGGYVGGSSWVPAEPAQPTAT